MVGAIMKPCSKPQWINYEERALPRKYTILQVERSKHQAKNTCTLELQMQIKQHKTLTLRTNHHSTLKTSLPSSIAFHRLTSSCKQHWKNYLKSLQAIISQKVEKIQKHTIHVTFTIPSCSNPIQPHYHNPFYINNNAIFNRNTN